MPNFEQCACDIILLEKKKNLNNFCRIETGYRVALLNAVMSVHLKAKILPFFISDIQALNYAYELIKSASEGQSALDSSDNISADLYVLCAEQALQVCNFGLLSVLKNNIYMMHYIYSCYSYDFRNLRST